MPAWASLCSQSDPPTPTPSFHEGAWEPYGSHPRGQLGAILGLQGYGQKETSNMGRVRAEEPSPDVMTNSQKCTHREIFTSGMSRVLP